MFGKSFSDKIYQKIGDVAHTVLWIKTSISFLEKMCYNKAASGES